MGSKGSRGGKGKGPKGDGETTDEAPKGELAQKKGGQGPKSGSEEESDDLSVDSEDAREAKEWAKERLGLDSEDLDSENLKENAKKACKKLMSESEGEGEGEGEGEPKGEPRQRQRRGLEGARKEALQSRRKESQEGQEG